MSRNAQVMPILSTLALGKTNMALWHWKNPICNILQHLPSSHRVIFVYPPNSCSSRLTVFFRATGRDQVKAHAGSVQQHVIHCKLASDPAGPMTGPEPFPAISLGQHLGDSNVTLLLQPEVKTLPLSLSLSPSLSDHPNMTDFID